ncbi:MAG: hypothetical protein OXU69_15880 [Gemmatimonadota bacterium]|nr:hypothetical protein [Gemmatimonadota bacterium]MDE2986182.1 hypothetical protein [Gemmatimonadota bacterium]
MRTETLQSRAGPLPATRARTPGGSIRALFALLPLLALATCDGGPGSEPETPAALAIRSGDGQTADARTSVPDPPAVQVTGASGAGVGGVTVSFAVTGGGGSVTSASAVTGSDGVASSGAWTLGDPGPQQLRAGVAGLDPVLFGATARDVPAELVIHTGDGQRATSGTAVADPVRVRVNGLTGVGLEGVAVGFQVTAGGGSVESASATTDGDGLASPGAWTLGDPGPQELRAIVTGLDPVTMRATALGVPAALAVVAGAGQEATVGTSVPVPPEVLVTDSAGTPLPDVPVAFLAGGGATTTGADAVTDTLGRAAVGSWTLGTTAGVYRLRAGVDAGGVEGNPAFIEANALPGPPSEIVIVEGDNQRSEAKLPVPESPKIQVRDSYANGLEGLGVTFRGSGGSVAFPSSSETDAGGFAIAERWILGPAEGPYRLTAYVRDGEQEIGTVRFTATATPSVYDIVIVHADSSALSERQLEAFARAEELWEKAVRGNLGWSTMRKGELVECLSRVGIDYEVPGDRVVDDLLIYADAQEVDGLGGVLAGAGPCYIRVDGSLPVVGLMYFDIADLDALEEQEEGRHLDGTVLHEMAHVMGFHGNLWQHLGLLEDPVDPDNPTGTEDPHFVGDSAIKAFLEIGGDAYAGGKPVPVENLGGRGVVNGHWREFVFRTELMTPFIDGGVPNPLSIVTLASFQDLGYTEVDLSVADEFELPSSSPGLAGDQLHRIGIGHDILRIPLGVVDQGGRVVRWVMPGGR